MPAITAVAYESDEKEQVGLFTNKISQVSFVLLQLNMILILLLATYLCGMHLCAAILDIETTTTYVNGQQEVLFSPQDSFIFTVPTCHYYDNQTVVVKVYNPQNPTNNPDRGIVYFAITNTEVNGTIAPADIICGVNHDTPTYSTKCMGKAGVGPLYIHVKGNNQYIINFALNVTFLDTSEELQLTPKAMQPFTHPTAGSIAQQELQQVVHYRGVIELAYGNRTLIHLRVCPGKLTTNEFKVTSILQADDEQGKSLIAQAICTTTECDFDTTPAQGGIGFNTHNVPVNIAESKYGKYNDIFVYAVAYNGVMKDGWPYGYFRYGAAISRR